MERYRKAWHVERNHLCDLKAQYRELCQQMFAAQKATDQAHERYKEIKDIWRTAKARNITDADNAAMYHKLSQP